jgi:hypothetical protein
MENKEIIEQAKKLSQSVLDRGENIVPICLVFKKDNTMEIIGLPFANGNEKEKARTWLKERLIKTPLEKYAVILDAKMTMLDINKKEEPKVTDVVIISIYSTKNRILQAYPYYKEKKLMDDQMIEIAKGREGKEGENKVYDCWDIWGEETSCDENSDAYNKYKNSHRELYRGLEHEEDENYDLKSKGKVEVFNMEFGCLLKIYRLDKKVMLEAIGKKGNVFFASDVMDDNDKFNKILADLKIMMKMLGDKLKDRE